MNNTGITRPVDNLGRVVIPIEIRNQLGIKEKDKILFLTEGTNIILRKYQQECVFCGKQKGLIDFKEQKICKKCYEEIKGVSINEEKEMP